MRADFNVFSVIIFNSGGNVGRILAVTNSNRSESGIRKKTIGRQIIIGPNAIKFVAVAIFAILALVYLAQSTSGANRSVKIRDLTSKQDQLELEKERLEAEQTRLQSLKEIDTQTATPTQQVPLQSPSNQVGHLPN